MASKIVLDNSRLDNGVDSIYSIINTSYTLKETVIDLVEAVIKDIEGAVGDIVNTGKEKVDEAAGDVPGAMTVLRIVSEVLLVALENRLQ